MARNKKDFRASALKAQEEALFEQYIGHGRQFAGTIENDPDAAQLDDEERWEDIGKICSKNNALVYWADGSAKEKRRGAAVVWPQDGSPGCWNYRGFRIIPDNGDSHSAEIFAVAAALEIATEKFKEQANVQLVRIYTDSMSLLRQLAVGTGRSPGPKMSGKYALQILYEQAEWLEEQGVQVNLVWVKGHHKSEGNGAADEIADYATSSGYEEFSGDGFDMYSGTSILPKARARPIGNKEEPESALNYHDMWVSVREEASRRKGKGWQGKSLYHDILDLKDKLDEQEEDADDLQDELDGLSDQIEDQEQRHRLADRLKDAKDREEKTYKALRSKLREQLEEWDHPMVAS